MLEVKRSGGSKVKETYLDYSRQSKIWIRMPNKIQRVKTHKDGIRLFLYYNNELTIIELPVGTDIHTSIFEGEPYVDIKFN
jgi:hypothetical protein